MAKVLGVIPARYKSERFPGKPLAVISGKTMVERVYSQCVKAKNLHKVIVATDDERIYQQVKSFGGDVMMTAESHLNGTSRCIEIREKMDEHFDVLLNIQGDEPFIEPEIIDTLAAYSGENLQAVSTLYTYINDDAEKNDPNVVKLVTAEDGQVFYFSRASIPFQRGEAVSDKVLLKKHIGLYAFPASVLEEIKTLSPHPYEITEKLEQLRWLFNGIMIKAIYTPHERSLSVDTPEDLAKAIEFCKRDNE